MTRTYSFPLWRLGMALSLMMFIPGAWAATVLETASAAAGQSWNTTSLWSNNAAPTSGNAYFTNGYTLRSPDSPNGSAAFGGGSLTVDGGTGGSKGGLLLKAKTASISDLTIGSGTIGNSTNNGTSNVTSTMSLTNLTISTAATSGAPAAITGQNTGNGIGIAAANLLGGGYLVLGGGSSANAYDLSIGSGSLFIGSFNLLAGAFTLSQALNLSSATGVSMVSSNASLALNSSLTASAFAFGGASLPSGIYTSSDLNTRFSTSAFSGAGTIAIVPEPSVGWMAGAGAVLCLFGMYSRRCSRWRKVA